MQIRMQNAEALTGQQIREFLKGSEGIEFTGQSRAEVYRWTERILARQEAARSDPQLCEQGNRAESAADHAADPELRGDRKSGGQAVPAAPVSEQVYRAGCGAAGRGGWGAPTLERAGDAAHSEARIRR